MFELGWFIGGVVLGVLGTLSIQLLYNWISTTKNQIQSLRHQLDHYRRYEEDWIEFQFTKKSK